MTATPHDLNTFLVTSRTRADVEHLVDLSDLTCSCEAALDFATTNPLAPCIHVEAALAYVNGKTIATRPGGSPFALLLCPKTNP